ncbi:hypothetical protein CJP74_07645 [Psittacicella melopsittaci]|uniref:Peptidyl-prolyl cis-trans isomerase n=1 Tax=Psittacicella melopsittaci TaxID=2028576 RepID=A0A3A1Y1M1_9GAMM|nr:FKBP-type peptidyl-prolyl cis-trans isomerase [Psittacicella melopsittaci]RIY31320.1 hypothetical protein CJP74_07645 [Psittacicella melopsittaci]
MKLFAGKRKTALTLLAASVIALGTLTACNKEDNTTAASSSTTTQAVANNQQTNNEGQTVTATAEDLKYVKQLPQLMLTDLKTQLGLTDEELKAFAEGVNDYVNGKATELSQEDTQALITYLNGRAQKVMTENLAKQAEENRKVGAEAIEKFLADNKDAVKDETGFAYLIEKQGDGEKVRATDTVNVKYKGSFVDGRVFDQNDKGVEFPLSGVIPGFRDAITKLNVGGKIIAYLPPELAYGEQGNQAIPPASTLVFEIEVVSAKPQAAEAPAKK